MERSSTNVKVKYFNEPEPIEYNIDDFLANAQPAPTHVIDVTKKAASTVQLEQAKFTPQERGDILPLQLRHVAQPSKWKKNQRVFDLTWGSSFDESGHHIPKCKTKNCVLDCDKITQEVMTHVRGTQ